MTKLIFVELNEINFDYVERYISRGYLPNFKSIIAEYGYSSTSSEKNYSELEPWIQWVSVRTGKAYSEHKVFRLGDIEKSNINQHWEILESNGLEVAAISPINGSNRTKNSKFFIPDPWVNTPVSGDSFIQKYSKAVSQAVNDNASNSLKFDTIITIVSALLRYFQIGSIPSYIRGIWGALKGYHWSRSLVFERLIGDTFISLWKKYKPDFSTVFLNSGAHIQHHYLFSSEVYDGEFKNPDWYVPHRNDPVLEILEIYDEILADIIKLNCPIMIATGLTQIPYPRTTYYYRLKNHVDFFQRINFGKLKVVPRMSRDFLIECENKTESEQLSKYISNLQSKEGDKIFICDNRGSSIFVELIYDQEIKKDFSIFDINHNLVLEDFYIYVTFVAIKNGHHSELGYFIDSTKFQKKSDKVPVKELFNRIMNHFGLEY
ncbi:hypothetical protein [Leptospira sp. GIMC2001]|uniref:hypothetical protein n=1 Tax=Leptospira sp. GIMC2001 TaxID=1513297 RepID=UPI00234B9286|nr:hypothetical protein [Leptospira sp. GIMC2001]WCL51254.1 hypothetical protein O4O04_10720 [Leptospira sp. GIMC2001]